MKKEKICKNDEKEKVLLDQEEDETVDEALTMQQRVKKRLQMKLLAPKIAAGKRRAKNRVASPEKLLARAEKHARNLMVKRLAKKSKDEMGYMERSAIEKKMDKLKPKIKQMAKKLLPQIKKDEILRVRGNKNNEEK
jgi:hypothetical protein